MKKKLLITSSLITILLALFPVSLYAEEVVQNPAPASTSAQGVLLDSYFYQNYDLLPYIESNGNQYINTGITGSSNIDVYCKLSDIEKSAGTKTLFGCFNLSNRYYLNYVFSDEIIRFGYGNGIDYFYFDSVPYVIYDIKFKSNDGIYINNELLKSFTNQSFNNINIYIFAYNYNNTVDNYSSYKLYNFYIYDHSLDQNNDEIGYVRYYYPAKAKTSGTIGLYDAVSKTFFPSLGSDPFENPTDDKVLHFQIGDFITAGLTWIDDIFDFVIDTPIILFFMAVGLAGAMYRWARRLVHF